MKVTLNETMHPCVFAQEGAREAVVGSQQCVRDMVAEDQRRRDLAYGRLNEMPGVSCQLPEGAIYAFPDLASYGKPSAQLATGLQREVHVATEAGSFYGASGEGHLRICFGSEPYERLEEAMDRVERYLEGLS